MDHGKGLESATMVGSFMSVGGDDEEMRELMDSETLNRTLTEIIEGKSDTSAHLNGFLDLSPNTDSESQNNETTGEDDSLAVLEKTVQSFERSLEDKAAV